MTLVQFLVLGLATWRVSSYLAEETGPWLVFDWLRHKAGVRYDKGGNVYGENELAKQLACMWCLPTVVGVLFTLGWLAFEAMTFYIALPFALSALAIMVNARGVRAKKLHW